MAATTTQTIRLMDCPACGKPIELQATYDVHRDVTLRRLEVIIVCVLMPCPPKYPTIRLSRRILTIFVLAAQVK